MPFDVVVSAGGAVAQEVLSCSWSRVAEHFDLDCHKYIQWKDKLCDQRVTIVNHKDQEGDVKSYLP